MPQMADTLDRAMLTEAIKILADCVLIFDAQDRLLAVDGPYHLVFPELAPEAVIGTTLREMLRDGLDRGGEFSPAETEALLRQCLADYHVRQSEAEIQLPDGRWMRRITAALPDGAIVAMGIDISAARNQIAALDLANAELFRVLSDRDRAEQNRDSIIETAAVGTWDYVPAQDRLRVGGRWGEILGLETAALDIRSVNDFLALLHPDDHARLHNPKDFAVGPNGRIVSSEFRMRHRDGHWVWVLSRSCVTEHNADGTPLRIAGVHLDISEQKQLEEEVAASRAFLLEVMDASASALVALDAQGRITFATREAAQVLGRSERFRLGQDFDIAALMLERMPDEAPAEGQSPRTLVARAQGPVRDILYRLRLPDGSQRTLACNAAPLALATDVKPARTGLVMSFRDITEKLAATARLQEALAQAEAMSRAKSTFLANMSHEIRTPLNGVLGMAEVLADVLIEPTQRGMIETIRKSGETLLTVLNGILDMSKIEAGKMELESVSFVPLELVRQVEAIYTITAEEKGIEFEVLASAGCERPRLGDPHRLTQILNNLLNNAIKFTAAGKVELKVSCRPGKPVLIEVSDTGIGMAPEQTARIFESFEQADGSMTRRFGGTGLGLAIVRQLVTLMGGTISADSRPGAGSRFSVSLPLPEGQGLPAGRTAAQDPVGRDGALAGLRLLSADDNATNGLVLSEMLVPTGAVLTQVENGRQAVEAWQAALEAGAPFALVLLDITMPVLDGMSALACIREVEAARGLPPVPAIAITAHAIPRQVADYIVGGFDTHLAKPFRKRDLLHAIFSLLASQGRV
ncbi:PAS domain-containing protein [bacterium]|nr:PAS domain-containing protein [bacterium]